VAAWEPCTRRWTRRFIATSPSRSSTRSSTTPKSLAASAQKVINELSTDSFQPEKYHDEFVDRVRAAVEQKTAGQQVRLVQEVPRAQIIDLFEALKQSLAETQGGGEAEAKPKPPGKAVPRTAKKAQTG
jgi:non-homologous end joining protein Ku